MITMKIKSMFFDRRAVTSKVPAARRKALSKSGAFIRRDAQTSMGYRKRGTSSTPGKPPFAHKGGRGPLLRKFLYFGYDPGADTVVVGPVRLGKGEAPPLHEYGGTAKRARVIRTGRKAFTPAQAQAYRRKVQSGQITREKKPTSTFTAKYPERPFMNPALERERPQMASRWKDSIRK